MIAVAALNVVFKALADPTRREILRRLKQRDMNAGEIADCFAISKPSISHHLNLLKQAELVLALRQGKQIVYSLNTTVFQDVMAWALTMGGRGATDDDEADAAGAGPADADEASSTDDQ